MAEYEKALEQAGLTEKEAQVYLILLEEGPTTAGPIIKRSGLHKATVYAIIQRLMERGLASYVVKGKAKSYSASDPGMLMEILREKEEELQKALPYLKARKGKAGEKETAIIYEGKRAVKASLWGFFNDSTTSDFHRVFVVSEKSLDEEWNPFFVKANRARARHGVKAKYIWSQSARKFSEQRKGIPLTEVKYVPEAVSTPAVINVHGNTTAINMVKAKVPVSIFIKNQEIADSFKKYFDLLWDQDVKIYRGPVEVKALFHDLMTAMKRGEEYLVLGATWGNLEESKLDEWFQGYHRERVKRGVRVKMLANPDVADQIKEKEFLPVDPTLSLSRLRVMPEKAASLMQLNIYKDKCAIFLFTKDPIAFVIENKAIADNYRKYFEYLWDQETQVLRGYGAVWDFLQEYTKAKEVRLIGARGTYFDSKPEHLPLMKELMERRKSPVKNLVEFSAKGNPWLSTPKLETRFLPEEFKSSSVTVIFDGTVIFAQWTTKEPIVLRINNKNVYESYVKQFDQLWKTAKPSAKP